MTLEQIKEAVDAGKLVRWSNENYDVIKTSLGHYLIRCERNQNYCGLTHRDGVTMNGHEDQFYID